MRISKIILILVLSFSPFIHAEKTISISNGFVSGNTFIALDTVGKNIYSQGVIDGMLIAPMYGAPKLNLAVLEQCTKGMTGKQLVAIFNKYLKSNPEIWHESMHTIIYRAMFEACNSYAN
ncbi:Rap1a/Tai family immunity protein [uncultured Shewanella sp.]|uniref:Rap1a/Tai family immunity protein n=1 Tax=uncultured Shewanella sp. TaxID=173975 RepID=UPI00261A6A2D|nr:Rap1a/Tai family immunity protein [uncultured Shewanella sp.]